MRGIDLSRASLSLRSKFRSNFVLIPEIIDADLETDLVKCVDEQISRLPYLSSHFDGVINGYRELLIGEERLQNSSVLFKVFSVMDKCIRDKISDNHHLTTRWMPLHILDLEKDVGIMRSHVDHIEYSGELIAGLSLLSARTMRFSPANEKASGGEDSGFVDVCLHPRSLYIQTGFVRYGMNHEIIDHGNRRISLILRNTVRQQH